jgi:uncharacterized membrane protein
MSIKNVLMVIPTLIFIANLVILLDILILREIIVFIFLSVIPGFAILKLFKLKEISFLDTILFSVGLSIVSVMFVGLLVNELYLYLGLSQPLSTIPLMVAISVFTLTLFFFEYRRDLSENLKQKISFEGNLKNHFHLSIILVLLPIISALGALYLNIFAMLLSYAIIAALCIISVVFRRLIPENLFPFLIFSISLAIICQVPLTSKYIVGYDANFEYYFFRLTQINGNWGFLDVNVNSLRMLNYNSMLSITILPAVYSALMNAKGEIVFKVLYPFIWSLIPLTLYRICEKQFGKLIGLLSTLFFVFTSIAFYGAEILSLNRQIIAELFLLLSIFLLISKSVPVTQRRLLLIIFGVAIIISHYSIAYIYLAIVVLVFVISRVKSGFDDTLNAKMVFLLLVITLSWYAIGSSAPLITLINTITMSFTELITSHPPTTGTSFTVFYVPQVFTIGRWINLILAGIANLFLIIGVLSIILRLKGKEIFPKFKVILTVASGILVLSILVPSIASSINFSRFYGITLLLISPCFVFGGQTVLEKIGIVWTKIKRIRKCKSASKNPNIERSMVLIGIILSAYFLSQVGFVNEATNDVIAGYTINLSRTIMSNDNQIKISLYGTYIAEQDVFSASWLQSHKVANAEVFSDFRLEHNVLVSYGLIPDKLLIPIANSTIFPQDSFIYLGTLNVVNGVITTLTGDFNTTEISTSLNQNDIVYSNSNSEIWWVVPSN